MNPNRETTERRVAISGSSGLVGRAVAEHFQQLGWLVHPLVRRTPRPDTREILWHPAESRVDAESLAGVDAVVHLAGENIAGGRWTAKRKAAIRDSRVLGTTLLAEALARLTPKPAVLVSASAVGYYGDRGDEILTEDSPAGEGFLPDVCREWEAATQPAQDAGIRVVHVRISMVLSRAGGALAKMLTPIRLGIAGRLGSGKQFMSWITRSDLVRVFARALSDERLAGPVNAAAPQPVTNAEFIRTLGRLLHRPTVLPAPAFALRLALGQMADDLLLASQRVEPARLHDVGFEFEQRTLTDGLHAALNEPDRSAIAIS